MNNSTMKTAVVFGNKVGKYYSEKHSCSTTVYIDERLLAQHTLYNSGAFKTVDYTDEKKMETYRKVNKMLGGK